MESETTAMNVHRELTWREKGQLWYWLGGPMLLTCLYKASQHGWSNEEYHTRCKLQAPLFVLARLENGAMFGGLSPLAVGTSEGYIPAHAGQCWLFRMYNQMGQWTPATFDCLATEKGFHGNGAVNGILFGNGELRLNLSNKAESGSHFDPTSKCFDDQAVGPGVLLGGSGWGALLVEVEVFHVSSYPYHRLPPSLPNFDSLGPERDFCRNYRPREADKQRLNILVMGGPGSGKSAFIDTCLASRTKKFGKFARLNQARRSGVSVKSYAVFNHIALDEVQGFSPLDFDESDLHLILSGHCSLEQDKQDRNESRSIHGVLILSSAQEVLEANYRAGLNQLFRLLKDLGHCPIVFLTKCDTLDIELVEHPEKIYESSMVSTLMQLMLFDCGLEDCSDVIPIISFAQYDHAEKHVEYTCLRALHRAVDQADLFLEFKINPRYL